VAGFWRLRGKGKEGSKHCVYSPRGERERREAEEEEKEEE